MIFYHDTKENSLYLTTLKNGSTLLGEISDRNKHLRYVEPDEATSIAHSGSIIYTPFRHPFPRFVSGLSVNFFNQTDGFEDVGITNNFLNEDSVRTYKNLIRYLDRTTVTLGNMHGSYYFRPYHLYDLHLDHWLYVPMTLLLYNFNVKFIPLFEFTNHVKEKFSNINDLVSVRERKNSFDKINKEYTSLWEAYKSIMIENPPGGIKVKNTNHISFDEWMKPEIEIFNLLNTHLNTPNLNFAAHKAFNRISMQGDYFVDVWSPRITNLYYMLKDIHRYKTPIDFFTTFEGKMNPLINSLSDIYNPYKAK